MVSLPIKQQKSFMQIRNRNYRLPIETGRWQNIQSEVRLYNFCEAGIGDGFLISVVVPYCYLVLLSVFTLWFTFVFTSEDTKRYKLWSCQNVCEALIYLLDNIYIRFGTKLYRQIVGIPIGTNCAPLIADLFLFCYERDFMTSLSDVKQAEIIEAFKSTSRYLDDLLNIDNPYFEGMVNRIYPPELQLNKANTSDTEAPFLDLHLSFSNVFVSSKIYDKRDDFHFDIVNFPFLDGDVPRSTSYRV